MLHGTIRIQAQLLHRSRHFRGPRALPLFAFLMAMSLLLMPFSHNEGWTAEQLRSHIDSVTNVSQRESLVPPIHRTNSTALSGPDFEERGEPWDE